MTEHHDDLTPALAAKGVAEHRIAEIQSPGALYQDIAATLAAMPAPTVGEDSQEWWSRVRHDRARSRRADRQPSNVVSMAEWKARGRAMLVLKTHGRVLYGKPADAIPPLPGEIVTTDGALGVYFEAADGTIKIDLETKNLFALEHFAPGRPFQIAFGDLEDNPVVVEQPVVFDDQGLATIVVADTPAIRRQLGRTSVFEIL